MADESFRPVVITQTIDFLTAKPSAPPRTCARVATLCGASTETDKTLGRRLVRALEYIRANARYPLSLADVASAAALSESHFRHLFVAATGSSFWAYLLWLRINLATDAAMAGAS